MDNQKGAICNAQRRHAHQGCLPLFLLFVAQNFVVCATTLHQGAVAAGTCRQNGSATATTVAKSPKKERESLDSIGGSIVASEIEDAAVSSPSPSPPAKKKARKSGEEATSSTTLYDDKSDQQLLQLLAQKVTETVWGHEGQKIGSTLTIRVCRAAAKSVAIRNIARAEGGVTQREIMDWMNDPSTGSIFTDYERMMLTKIER